MAYGIFSETSGSRAPSSSGRIETEQVNHPSTAGTEPSTLDFDAIVLSNPPHVIDRFVRELFDHDSVWVDIGLSSVLLGDSCRQTREWAKANQHYGQAVLAFSELSTRSRIHRQAVKHYLTAITKCLDQLPPGVRT
jgi:hypothetical protein